MIPKTIRRRGRRGTGRRGLKIGRSAIADMADDDFDALVARTRRFCIRAPRSEGRRVRRLLTLIRKSDALVAKPRFIKQGLRRSDVLDALYPERVGRWLPAWRRTEDIVIDIERFSFIDHPRETLRTLRRIAEAEASARNVVINLQDGHCLDIGPFMVLGMLREKMLPVVRGGRITRKLRQVIEAVDLSAFLRMRFSREERSQDVYPFPLRQRRRSGSSRSDNFAMYVTSEEAVDTRFADTVNAWLAALEPPLELPRGDRAQLMTLIGEILDNAKRHSDPIAEDGTWTIAGFMEARSRGDDTTAYVCHLAIISPGATIFETLQEAPADVRESLRSYARVHRRAGAKCDEEALWTACSLQDTVSRVPISIKGSAGGFGMMTLVETIAELGRSSKPDEQPAMAILSGASCVLVRSPHTKPMKKKSGHRVLAFNADNSLEQPPDPEYVFNLPHRFPGTIVAARFHLDAGELLGSG